MDAQLKALAEDALRRAMLGPTSGGLARKLAPVILDAIIAGKIPGIAADGDNRLAFIYPPIPE